MTKLLIVWGNWGPYHYARFKALHSHAAKLNIEAIGLECFATSGCYEWKTSADHPAVRHLNLGKVETEFNPRLLLTRLLPFLYETKPDVIFVPSYWHWSLFLNYAGRLCGARIVMMNESHAGTERARGLKRAFKKAVVRNFHSALVGGSPHRRHFASLGLKSSRIHLGYDTVDHDYFATQSAEVRAEAARFRERYDLPQKYFLNLGRMVSKKNLPCLIEAFALWRKSVPSASHELVLVGSGEEEEKIRAQCRHLGLRIIDHAVTGPAPSAQESSTAASTNLSPPEVHFYGFRQIEENPIFYALATAFILPSLYEEWGLVVNEAMASRLPVLVSERAGCAEDLVEHGRNGLTFNPESAKDLAACFERVAQPSIPETMGAHSQKISSQWSCDRFASGALDALATATGLTLRPESELSPHHATTL